MLRSLIDTRSGTPPLAAGFGDMKQLETELKRGIKGEVRFDRGSRALYATDASNYRQVPIGVDIPRTNEDVIYTVRQCYRHALADDIHACTPIIGREPACVSVFREELPKLTRRAVVHAHCHHKSVLKTDAEESVMKKLGIDFRMLDSDCCGMAGSFGFERDKYEVSMTCAERVAAA